MLPLAASSPSALDRIRASLPREVASSVQAASRLPRPGGLERIPTGLCALDTLLQGGLPKGKLIELTGHPSGGRFSIVTASLAVVTGMGEPAALVDLGDHFDPKLATEAGIDLSRLLWLRPRTFRQALEAAEISAGTGFPLLVLDLGFAPLRLPRGLDAAPWLRLARLAGLHGTALLVSTPFPLTGLAAEAVVRADVRSLRGEATGVRSLRGTAVSGGAGVRRRLVLERQRSRRPGETARLSLSFPWSITPLPAETEERKGETQKQEPRHRQIRSA